MSLPTLDRGASSELSLRAMGRLLKQGASEQGHLDVGLLPVAEQVARSVWQTGSQIKPDDEAVQHTDGTTRWIDRSINHWAGDLATFWAESVFLRWRSAPDTWDGMPSSARDELELMLGHAGEPGDAARPILAGLLHFFFGADETWAVARLVPMLDWETDHAHAEQAWDGYLTRGRWNDRMLSHLLPHFVESFDKLDGVLAPKRSRFCTWLSDFSVRSSVHPLEHGWLSRFIAAADEESHIEWIDAVSLTLWKSGTHRLGKHSGTGGLAITGGDAPTASPSRSRLERLRRCHIGSCVREPSFRAVYVWPRARREDWRNVAHSSTGSRTSKSSPTTPPRWQPFLRNYYRTRTDSSMVAAHLVKLFLIWRNWLTNRTTNFSATRQRGSDAWTHIPGVPSDVRHVLTRLSPDSQGRGRRRTWTNSINSRPLISWPLQHLRVSLDDGVTYRVKDLRGVEQLLGVVSRLGRRPVQQVALPFLDDAREVVPAVQQHFGVL